MASEQSDQVFPDEDLDDDEEESLDDDEDDDEEELLNDEILVDDDVNSPSPSTSSLGAVTVTEASPVTVAIPGAVVSNVEPPISVTNTTALTTTPPADRKRDRFEHTSSTMRIQPVILPDERKPLDDSRKLFQRLWTDEDEIELLQGFLDYTTQRGTTQRGTTQHHQYDTALFYDQIKSKLQLDFNKNQLVEKLRRLKKKYRNVMSKISTGKEFNFKSAHDQATFQISRKIWSDAGRTGGDDHALDDEDANPNPNLQIVEVKDEEMIGNSGEKKTATTPRSRKRSRSRPSLQNEETHAMHGNSNKEKNSGHVNNSNVNNVSGLIEETVRSCLSPLFKELLNNAMAGPCGSRTLGGLGLNPMTLTFGGGPINFGGGGEMLDERWRKQQILELEVYSKRLELVQDQIKTALEELRSRGG